MKLLFNYIDNELFIEKNSVLSIEIENKNYFYRTVNCFNSLKNSEKSDEINIYNDNFEEVNLCNKIGLYIDYFNLDFNTKKNITKVYKLVEESLDDKSKSSFSNVYNKTLLLLKNKLNELDINIALDDEYKLENILKIVKLSIEQKDTLQENLFLLIDLEKTLELNNVLVFINLKQYLNKEELYEFYKYIIYNELYAIFIDSQSYGTSFDNEKKLIIDDDLDEFML